MSEETQEAWIAVAIAPDGHWCAFGWRDETTEQSARAEPMDIAVDSLGEGSGEMRVWVKVMLPLPVVATLDGEVVEADDE